ncbi:class I SAM-dependent methyltransferase [Glacieibacterium frigidum]|uniref:class I SAM-dependent methyltransferase n=1 Tax=Glacieibacterium frigidum TaxID=2593303 RepID=UPI00163D7686|nr:class I SAM-dependent methyltransferase [Glacieibacterium frigidum]
MRRANAGGFAIVPHHYYSPMVTGRDLRHELREVRQLPGLVLDLDEHRAFLEGLCFAEELRAIPMEQASDTKYGFRNKFFSSGDAEILYGVIRRDRPKRILEVGSGRSTLVARMAILRNQADDPDYTCEQICIEPYEMPWLESVGVKVQRERVEMVDLTLFDTLEAGDILFVDSSHVIRPQGDVLREVLEIYPRLKPGVLIQVHDIFTPRDYHHRWVIDDMRMWNEQYLLEAFLAFNPAFKVVCALNWLVNDHPELLREACPVLTELLPNQPGSFWFQRV